jgi:DNA-directed RNA polymerase subunit L/DNA-directed RNA polymerase alpha subunit
MAEVVQKAPIKLNLLSKTKTKRVDDSYKFHPKVVGLQESGDNLEMEISDVNRSIVNSLRRTILTYVPILVFRGFPHSENRIHISKNTSKFNNEYLKHRIQCIPIFVSDETRFESMVENYAVKLKVVNDTNQQRYVTTKDFVLVNIQSGKSVSEDDTRKIFPPDMISNDYIPICVLMPRISETDEPEEIDATIHFSIGTAKEDNCWNVVSKCTMFDKQDDEKIQKFKMSEEYKRKTEVEKRDFDILDAQRMTLNNHFVFKMHSIGIYDNQQIIQKSIRYITDKMTDFLYYLANKASFNPVKIGTYEDFSMSKDSSSIRDKYSLRIEFDDYTIGGLIENHLYLMFNKELSYVAFEKDHPHEIYCNILFSYKNNDVPIETIVSHLSQVANEIIHIYKTIESYLRK